MSASIPDIPKKKGRPAGGGKGRDLGLMVRVPPPLLSAIDTWIEERRDSIPPDEMTRPEAVRRLAAEALTAMGLFPVQGGK